MDERTYTTFQRLAFGRKMSKRTKRWARFMLRQEDNRRASRLGENNEQTNPL